MAEYIEREATCKGCVRYGMGETLCADCVVKVAPAADVVEVKHGEWERYLDFWRKCSLCGSIWHEQWVMSKELNYCANCGAKMDGE